MFGLFFFLLCCAALLHCCYAALRIAALLHRCIAALLLCCILRCCVAHCCVAFSTPPQNENENVGSDHILFVLKWQQDFFLQRSRAIDWQAKSLKISMYQNMHRSTLVPPPKKDIYLYISVLYLGFGVRLMRNLSGARIAIWTFSC